MRSPTPTLLAQWRLPVDGLGLEPGTEFTFQAPPQPGWDGTVHCRTVAVDEPRSLSYGAARILAAPTRRGAA